MNHRSLVAVGLASILACSIFAAPVLAQDPTARRTQPAPEGVKESSAAPLPIRGGCLAIPDALYDGTLGSMACLNVPDLNTGQAILDVNVNLTAEHTWIGDLVVKVVAPGGTVGTVLSRPGFVEPADDGTGCCGDSSNLTTTSPITFDDQGGGPLAEAMGGTIGDAQFVCQDDGQCNFVSAPGAASGSGLADFNGLIASGGNWQVCVGDSAASDTGNLCVATLDFTTGTPADLAVTKTAPEGVVQDMGAYSFQIDVANAGPGDHAVVTVTDSLPANVTFTGSSCGATAAGQDITWNVGGLVSGASSTCQLFVNNNVGGCPTVVNTAEVEGEPGVADPAGNNSSTYMNAPAGANVVADPGFETGTPNASWTEASSNFGTPLCDVGSCGTGGGTAGPRTGAWWTWFGGIAGLEVGSVEQSVVIGTGQATLEFGYWIGACGAGAGAGDFVRALVDGNEVWREDAASAECGAPGYSTTAIDVSAYADGGSHLVRFESTSGTAAAVSNFHIDDVTLTVTGEPTCTEGAPPAPSILEIPTLNRAGLLLIGLLLAAAGVIALRRH